MSKAKDARPTQKKPVADLWQAPARQTPVREHEPDDPTDDEERDCSD